MNRLNVRLLQSSCLIQNQQIKTVEDMGRRVLITGGAGFIGSHTCLVLLEQGHELVVLDNFDNSSPEALRRVQELTGSTQLTLVEGDVRNASAVGCIEAPGARTAAARVK